MGPTWTVSYTGCKAEKPRGTKRLSFKMTSARSSTWVLAPVTSPITNSYTCTWSSALISFQWGSYASSRPKIPPASDHRPLWNNVSVPPSVKMNSKNAARAG